MRWVTLATHREIEQKHGTEFQLTAVAPMAGPYDMLSTAKILMGQTEYQWPYYLAFFITAYDDIYGWNRLNDIFNSPYGDMMHLFFDGTKSSSEINNSLPTKITELINQDYLSKFFNGEEPEIFAALQENNLLNWAPQTPIRFYHGDADEAVPYQNALTAVDSLRAMGGNNIELVTIANGTHESASLPSILGMLGWFEKF
ncbi:prolyl oligopeptidase family serine peptidase [candidate division KSB1 bacterium]|nr:prolyl oligopeptidase family serine peptidase [candidate division KSB1 bacterium]